jgi:hypothetical protein
MDEVEVEHVETEVAEAAFAGGAVFQSFEVIQRSSRGQAPESRTRFRPAPTDGSLP